MSLNTKYNMIYLERRPASYTEYLQFSMMCQKTDINSLDKILIYSDLILNVVRLFCLK